ncbi:MAG: dTMP kinase [Nitrososphaeria archaeon]
MLLIAIDGIDQSGKKTQTGLLLKRLLELNYKVIKFSFPNYETPVGQLIEKILLNEIIVPLEVKHILLSANRWELKPKIEEYIKKNYIIIFDRYYQSNLAYGVANGLPLDWLINLDKNLPDCDLTIILDIPPEISFKRKELNRDVHEKDFNYLVRVRKCFLELANKNSWVVIDGNRPISEVHNSIWSIVSERLKVKYIGTNINN